MIRTSALFFAIAVFTACGPNQQILKSAQTPTPAADATPAPSSFEQEVQAMRTANFNFIYVFRRRDGMPIDTADKKFASDNVPVEINRRKIVDDGRAIILGSNYRLPPEKLQLLSGRFAFTDYSNPENEIISTNTNSGK